jgi:hypothetical protein
MALPQGQSGETSRVVNLPGVYRHPETGAEVITSASDGGTLAEGTTQADALKRVGFERVGDPLSREELLNMQKEQATKDALETDKSVKDTKDK